MHGDAAPRRLVEASGDTVERGAPVFEEYERSFRTELRSRGEVEDVKLAADSIGHVGCGGLDDPSPVGTIVRSGHDEVRFGRVTWNHGAHGQTSESLRRS